MNELKYDMDIEKQVEYYRTEDLLKATKKMLKRYVDGELREWQEGKKKHCMA